MADPLLTPTEFARQIKAKYPDYANVPDDELATRMLEKYPEYRDRVRPPDFTATNEPPSESLLAQAGHLGAGAVRGAVSTVQTFAKPIRWATGMASATPPPAETTTAGQIGRGLEQVAEILVPASKLSTAGRIASATLAPRLAPIVGKTAAKFLPAAAVEAAGSAGLATMQGGSPVVGAIGGAITPALGAAVESLPTGLKQQALKQVTQALGPTKEKYKAIAARLAPEMLKRGLRGSRETLGEFAAGKLETVGDELDAALQAIGSKQVGTQPILDALETAKDAFRATNIAGKVVEYEPRAIRQLDGLRTIITKLGPDATIDQLVAVRRAWDQVVAQAGGFAHRAGGAIGVPLKDQSEAWAKREATGAIRELLKTEAPDLAAVNKEWSFWKDLSDVLTQTLQRTQPQGVGVGKMLAESAGTVVGGTVGATGGMGTGIGGAFAFGKLAGWAKSVIASPQWRLASAQAKDRLADAIANNDAGKIAMALSRITTVQASKVGQ